jgi:hypothetical protein
MAIDDDTAARPAGWYWAKLKPREDDKAEWLNDRETWLAVYWQPGTTWPVRVPGNGFGEEWVREWGARISSPKAPADLQVGQMHKAGPECYAGICSKCRGPVVPRPDGDLIEEQAERYALFEELHRLADRILSATGHDVTLELQREVERLGEVAKGRRIAQRRAEEESRRLRDALQGLVDADAEDWAAAMDDARDALAALGGKASI